jgi:hypothetical protein
MVSGKSLAPMLSGIGIGIFKRPSTRLVPKPTSECGCVNLRGSGIAGVRTAPHRRTARRSRAGCLIQLSTMRKPQSSYRPPVDGAGRRLSAAEHLRDGRHELKWIAPVREIASGDGHATPLLFFRRYTVHEMREAFGVETRAGTLRSSTHDATNAWGTEFPLSRSRRIIDFRWSASRSATAVIVSVGGAAPDVGNIELPVMNKLDMSWTLPSASTTPRRGSE